MSEEVEGFYEELLKLWQDELSSEGLIKIPDDFERKLYSYVARLKQLLKVSDKRSLTFSTKSAELESIKKLVASLLETRYRKIISMLIAGIELENLMEFEKDLAFSISKAMHDYKQKVKSLLHDLKIPSKDELEIKYELVCFMQDFPKIVGEDLKSYGPFKQFDIATLPPQNAIAMLNRKVVSSIDLR